MVAGWVHQLPHSATDSLNGRSSISPSQRKTEAGWPTPLRQPRESLRTVVKRSLTNFYIFSATTEVPVAEASAEAEAVPEVASNGAAAEKEETNGEAAKETTEAAKETTEAETTNGSTEEVKNGEEETATNGSTETEEKETTGEAVKRKAEEEETKEEEGSAEKIAKLKEVAAEKLNEAEEKLPAEPLTEAEAIA